MSCSLLLGQKENTGNLYKDSFKGCNLKLNYILLNYLYIGYPAFHYSPSNSEQDLVYIGCKGQKTIYMGLSSFITENDKSVIVAVCQKMNAFYPSITDQPHIFQY